MLTLVLFRIPTGMRAGGSRTSRVDERARGEAPTPAEAIRIATESGARTVDLTSRREREAANRL